MKSSIDGVSNRRIRKYVDPQAIFGGRSNAYNLVPVLPIVLYQIVVPAYDHCSNSLR